MLNLINVGRAAPVIYQVQVPKSDNAFAVNFMRPLQDAHKGFSSSSACTAMPMDVSAMPAAINFLSLLVELDTILRST